ncbi:MAG TPA: AAA family ATPase [bacterium]|nr:AAA family ATPase [bacterium]HQO33461.1 AAA family ATPase [bacterium]HQP97030.1 AAA family ATPase [bacterium]
MTPDPNVKSGKENPEELGITKITVEGFKSIAKKQSIEIRPLTILAGANSSGKSSIMQPLLLLKQTVECPYDPGPLKLDGPNVFFTLPEQFLSKSEGDCFANRFVIGIDFPNDMLFREVFGRKTGSRDFELLELTENRNTVRPDMTWDEFSPLIPNGYRRLCSPPSDPDWRPDRERCFLRARLPNKRDGMLSAGLDLGFGFIFGFQITRLIHVPALRDNPRTYERTAAGPSFPGVFSHYTASVILDWKAKNDGRLHDLGNNLEKLGLTWKVDAVEKDATSIEIRVGRLKHAAEEENDLVSIADVGFGVSQVLPVLVALLVARPGQLVYLEQPEIHLHPRAQEALAEILADAANRGVRVVAETHSAMLLLAIQSLVAEGKIETDKVILHWFERNEEDGTTKIHRGDLNEAGAYGKKWPVDFGKVELELQSRYLNAAEPHLWGKSTK